MKPNVKLATHPNRLIRPPRGGLRPKPRLRFAKAAPRQPRPRTVDQAIRTSAARVLTRDHIELAELLCRSPQAMRHYCRLIRRHALDFLPGQAEIGNRQIIEILLKALEESSPTAFRGWDAARRVEARP